MWEVRGKKKKEKINNRMAKTQTTPNQLRINSFITHSSLHHSFVGVNFVHPSPPSIPLFFYPLSLSLQLSQCNVNDVPSIAPDSARTLTSSPPPFLHRPVISLFSHTHMHSLLFTPLPQFFSTALSSTLHLSSLSLPHKVTAFRPRSPTASHVCHHSSLLHFILRFHSPLSISLVLHCSFRESSLSPSLQDPVIYVYPSSFLHYLGPLSAP